MKRALAAVLVLSFILVLPAAADGSQAVYHTPAQETGTANVRLAFCAGYVLEKAEKRGLCDRTVRTLFASPACRSQLSKIASASASFRVQIFPNWVVFSITSQKGRAVEQASRLLAAIDAFEPTEDDIAASREVDTPIDYPARDVLTAALAANALAGYPPVTDRFEPSLADVKGYFGSYFNSEQLHVFVTCSDENLPGRLAEACRPGGGLAVLDVTSAGPARLFGTTEPAKGADGRWVIPFDVKKPESRFSALYASFLGGCDAPRFFALGAHGYLYLKDAVKKPSFSYYANALSDIASYRAARTMKAQLYPTQDSPPTLRAAFTRETVNPREIMKRMEREHGRFVLHRLSTGFSSVNSGDPKLWARYAGTCEVTFALSEYSAKYCLQPAELLRHVRTHVPKGVPKEASREYVSSLEMTLRSAGQVSMLDGPPAPYAGITAECSEADLQRVIRWMIECARPVELEDIPGSSDILLARSRIPPGMNEQTFVFGSHIFVQSPTPTLGIAAQGISESEPTPFNIPHEPGGETVLEADDTSVFLQFDASSTLGRELALESLIFSTRKALELMAQGGEIAVCRALSTGGSNRKFIVLGYAHSERDSSDVLERVEKVVLSLRARPDDMDFVRMHDLHLASLQRMSNDPLACWLRGAKLYSAKTGPFTGYYGLAYDKFDIVAVSAVFDAEPHIIIFTPGIE
ncbi:MAG: hypothetical protein U5N86_12555 [Planctomycetota bacterium]|nr:hypothetical protein [Planctomycetota bacterium]